MATKSKSLTPREFVELWQKSATFAEVCEKSGLKPASAKARADAYRDPPKNDKGFYVHPPVPLKKFPPQRVTKNDWEDLAALATSLAPVATVVSSDTLPVS